MSLTEAAGRALRSIGHGLAQIGPTMERDRFRLKYGADADEIIARRAAATQYLMKKQADEEEQRLLENENKRSIIAERQMKMQREQLEAQDAALGRYRTAAGVLSSAGDLPPGEMGPPAPPDFSSLDESQLPAWARSNPAALQQDIMRTQAVARDKEGVAQANAERQATLPYEQLKLQQAQLAETIKEHRLVQEQRLWARQNHVTTGGNEEKDAEQAWREAAKIIADQLGLQPNAQLTDQQIESIRSAAGKLLNGKRAFRKNHGVPVRGGLKAVVEPPVNPNVLDLSDIIPGLTVTEE